MSQGTAYTANTVFVDAAFGTANGMRQRADYPFDTLAHALGAAQANDIIQMRPGNYPTSTPVTINTTVTINGYGAKLVAGSENQVILLQVKAADVKVRGLELACGRVSSNTGVNNGHIEVTAGGFEIRDAYIHDGVGIGVRLMQGADWARVSNCRLSNLADGIIVQGSSPPGPSHIIFDHNRVENTILTSGGKGIYIGTPDSVAVSTDINIEFNDVTNTGDSGIEVWRNHNQFRIVGNRIEGTLFAISVDGGHNGTISANQIKAPTFTGIEIPNGCDHITVSANDIDGRNSSGTLVTPTAISLSNAVVSSDNVIVGNTIRGFINYAMDLQNGSSLTIIGNSVLLENTGASMVRFKGVSYSSIMGNTCRISSGDAPIYFDSTDFAMTDLTISGNKFSGSPSSKLVQIYANVHAIANVTILNNTAWDCSFLPTGFITYTTQNGGSLGTFYRRGNVPARTTLLNNQFGWDNPEEEKFSVLREIDFPGGAYIGNGTGDGASYSTFDTAFRIWWGLGMIDLYGNCHGYYDARTGTWDVQHGYKINATAQWTSGAGSPNGVVTAPVGSLYTRTDGGPLTTLYVKESGSGNIGWVSK